MRNKLEDQVLTPVSYDEFVWSFLCAESHKLQLQRESCIIVAPNFNDPRENRQRTELLDSIRGKLVQRIPRSTRWFRLQYLHPAHFQHLRVIGRCGWDNCNDQNELLSVCRRMPIDLESAPDHWPPLILWGHSHTGPLTIFEGNHRLVACARSAQVTRITAAVFVGLSDDPCIFHMPDDPTQFAEVMDANLPYAPQPHSKATL